MFKGFGLLIQAMFYMGILTLAGCASVDSAPLIEKQSEAFSEIPPIWETELADGLGGLERAHAWQDLFDDPILARHLMKAEAENLDLRQAALNVRQARLAISQARSTLLPTVNASGNSGAAGLLTNLDGISENFGDNLSASWDPDVFGVRKLQVRQSRINARIQSHVNYNIRQQVLANVINIYVSIIQSDLQIKLSEQNLEFLKERLRIADAQYKAGRNGLDQVSFADNNYQSAIASLEAQKFTSRQLRRALSALLGGFSDQDIAIADQLPKVPNLPERGVPSQVLHKRPDVKIAEEQINLALNAYEITVKSDWPVANLSGSIGGGGRDITDIFNPSSYVLNLGASIFGNIYDGGLNAAQREAMQLGVEAAISNYKNTLRLAKNNIENIYDQSRVNESQLNSLIAAAKSGDRALELEQIRFDLGQSDLLSVLQVQQSALNTNISRINIEAAFVSTLVNAYIATGGDLIFTE